MIIHVFAFQTIPVVQSIPANACRIDIPPKPGIYMGDLYAI